MAETVSMPKLGFDMREGVLVRWVKNEGENINKGDVLAEIETDKATVEVESTAAGVVRKLLASQGDAVPVGAPIAIIGTADEKIDVPAGSPQKTESKVEAQPATQAAPAAGPAAKAVVAPKATTAAPAVEEGPVKASPLAKKIARDNQVDLGQLQGSGPGGRVVRRDVEAALTPGGAGSKTGALPMPSFTAASYEDEIVQLTKLRQAIARRMTESKTSVPHFYVSHEYKMDAVMALRKQANEFLAEDAKLSVNDFIVKAVALALRQFPNLNATFAGDKVIRHGAVNVGVAVAVENGLLTVVNKNTDQQPLRQISLDVKRMVKSAREGKVRPDDIEGSTFSISNLGMYDVENFIAIVNPPEAAILAVGSAREVPVVEQGAIKIGWRMKATVSVDHRVSDGAEAAQFMQALAAFIEEPLRLLL
jgi:pyruvate dehydrogenase E2 component (dihydrolipoamide acetyltransferase)